VIGGTPHELRLVALAVEQFRERLELLGRPWPIGLEQLRNDVFDALNRLEPSTLDSLHGSGDGPARWNQPPLLLTMAEVAEALRCSASTVERLVRDGSLPVRRLGRSVRVRPEDLEAFVAAMGEVA
jgi:excisionase family DNA binding protein